MWKPFLYVKHAIFGKSHQSLIAEQIESKRTPILESHDMQDQASFATSTGHIEPAVTTPVTPDELAHYILKDGLDVPGQVNTYLSEAGGGAGLKISVDFAKLAGLGVATPEGSPLTAKAGLKAKVDFEIDAKAVKGSLLCIEFQPDLAGYAQLPEKYTPICFSHLKGVKGTLKVALTGSIGIEAEVSAGIAPAEALEMSAFSVSAQALSATASGSYEGTYFKLTDSNPAFFKRDTSTSYITALAKKIDEVIDPKGKITSVSEIESGVITNAIIPAKFQGWMQSGKASASANLFKASATAGTIKSEIAGWYNVSAALLDSSVELLSAQWQKQSKRMSYTFETPARGLHTIEHNVKVDYNVSSADYTIFSLQLNAGQVKCELFAKKKGQSDVEGALRTNAQNVLDPVMEKLKEQTDKVSRAFYDTKKVGKIKAAVNSMTYHDTLLYKAQNKTIKKGSGFIYGQSVNLSTLARYTDVVDYLPKLVALGVKKDALTSSDELSCSTPAYKTMIDAAIAVLKQDTTLMSQKDFKESTELGLFSPRKTIAASDKVINVYHQEIIRLGKKVKGLVLAYTHKEAIDLACQIDILLGLLGTLDDNLTLWIKNKGEKVVDHGRTGGVRDLLSAITTEKNRLFDANKDLLLLNELSQVRVMGHAIADVLQVTTDDFYQFIDGAGDTILSLTKDPGVMPDAVLVESAFEIPEGTAEADLADLAQATKTLQSIRLRYRTADRANNKTTLFKLGFSIGAASAAINLTYFDQFKSEGIINLSTRWYGENAKYNDLTTNPERYVPPALLITE